MPVYWRPPRSTLAAQEEWAGSSLNFLATVAFEGIVCIGLSRVQGTTSRYVDWRLRHMLSDRLARVA
jgi:hypothetical protein